MATNKLALTLAAFCLLTGCHLFQSSEVQRSVQQAKASRKPAGTTSVEAIHQSLQSRGIAHKIVQFRYDVGERILVPPVNGAEFTLRSAPQILLPARRGLRQRTGIIYRDDSDRKNPWWYVDAETPRPVWLPNEEITRQISFAIRRHAELLRVEEFDRGIDGLTKESPATMQESSDGYWSARFRRVHGSDFDPASPLDREKMARLRNG